MPTVKEIYDFIDGFAPFCIQDGFDNSGLAVGSLEDTREINRVLIALDATNSVVDEAAEKGAQMIITHHPIIFHPVKHLDMSQPFSRALAKEIFCLGVHTCLDSAEYGISDMMVDKLGFENLRIVPHINRRNPMTGAPVGYGAMAKCPKMSAEELARLCEKRFGTAGIRWVDGGKMIDTVACGSGSSSEIMEDAARLGAQAIVTADVKHDRFLEAELLGVTLIDAGHYETEAIALPYLKARLEERFAGLECEVTEADRVKRGFDPVEDRG